MKYKIKYFGFKLAQMCQITPGEESEEEKMEKHDYILIGSAE